MNIMGFTYDLLTPKFDLGDTITANDYKVKFLTSRNKYKTYFLCDDGDFLYLRDYKNDNRMTYFMVLFISLEKELYITQTEDGAQKEKTLTL